MCAKKLKPLKLGRRGRTNRKLDPRTIVSVLEPYWAVVPARLELKAAPTEMEVTFFARIGDARKAVLDAPLGEKEIHGPYRIEHLAGGGMRLIDLQNWTPQ